VTLNLAQAKIEVAVFTENETDLVEGGADSDLPRGGRGRGHLVCGTGDDVVQGGQDDDRSSVVVNLAVPNINTVEAFRTPSATERRWLVL
jgi:hypothetical protein